MGRVASSKLKPDAERYLERLQLWRRDPNAWVDDFYPDQKFTTQQRQAWSELGKLICAKIDTSYGLPLDEEAARYARKIGISIMSGNGTGKDAWSAITILYFLMAFKGPKIPCTAPSKHQLNDVLWAEIAKWIRLSTQTVNGQGVIADEIEHQSEKVFLKSGGGAEHFAVARSVNTKASAEDQAETLAGLHEDYLVFFVDEASGVPDPVFRPIEGTLTGKMNIAILIFNPTRSRGFAIRSQYEDAARWVTLRWNAEESERVEKTHVKMMEEKYGRDSNTYRIRVLGLPPVADSGTLIASDWIYDAINREVEPRTDDALIKTADFGAGGDKSVLCTRRGPKVYPFKRKQTQDSNVLTDWIMADLHTTKPDAFGGDVIGIGWAVMGNIRKRAPRSITVRSVDFRGRASDARKFLNKRMELYWKLREEFENGEISIPEDQDVIDQLNALKYDTNERGQMYMISKDKLRKELEGESPDETDALASSEIFERDALRKHDDYDEDSDKDEDYAGTDQNAFMGA